MSGSAVSPPLTRIPEALTLELGALLGDRFSTSPAVRDHHSRDESYHAPEAPDAVAFPESTAEVGAIVKACARYRACVISFWAGHVLEGYVAGRSRRVAWTLTRMNRVAARERGGHGRHRRGGDHP